MDAPYKLTPDARVWPVKYYKGFDDLFEGNFDFNLTGNYSSSQLDESGLQPMHVYVAGNLAESRSGLTGIEVRRTFCDRRFAQAVAPHAAQFVATPGLGSLLLLHLGPLDLAA